MPYVGMDRAGLGRHRVLITLGSANGDREALAFWLDIGNFRNFGHAP